MSKMLTLSVALLINGIVGIIVSITSYSGLGSIIFMVVSLYTAINGIAGILYSGMPVPFRILGKLVGTDVQFAKRAVVLSLIVLGGTLAASNLAWIVSLICTYVVIATARAMQAGAMQAT